MLQTCSVLVLTTTFSAPFSGLYHERLLTMLHRLQLSTQLYRSPDRPEDIAANIIEQVITFVLSSRSAIQVIVLRKRVSCCCDFCSHNLNLFIMVTNPTRCSFLFRKKEQNVNVTELYLI